MRMTPFYRLVLLVFVGVLLTGCGSAAKDDDPAGNGGSNSPTARSDLDVTYVVSGITEAGKKRSLVSGSEIRFAFQDGQLRITAGCNSMSGAYRLEGSRLTVESLATTEMGCEQPLMAQDTWVAGLFAQPVQLSTGNDAAIISGDVVLALTDREAASPDKPLAKTIWVLDTLGDKDTVSSIEQVVGYLVFSEGQVGIYDGCNEGSASAAVEDGRISFGDRTSTLRGCLGGTVEEVQKAFSEVLDGTATYTIEERVLTVTNGDRSLGFQAATKLPQHD